MEPKITKLPPGEAVGARDLQNWSVRRMNGQSGDGPQTAKRILIVCQHCKHSAKRRPAKQKQHFRCSQCGSNTVKTFQVAR